MRELIIYKSYFCDRINIMLTSIKEELFKEKSFKTRHWNIFKKYIEIVEYKKHDIITSYNQVENYLYFIIKGGVRAYYAAVDKEISVVFRFEEQFISSYASFLTREPSMQILNVLEDSTLIRISYESVQKLMKYRVGERIFRLNAEELFILKEEREVSLLIDTPDERYNNLLTMHKDWFQRIPQHQIASYLGMSAETLSRVKKRNT